MNHACVYSTLIACAVSEIPYDSHITGQEEKLPFAVTIMGNAGE